jgi:hypothetical protein
MTSKRIYKVTLTGWVVKNEDDSEVKEWTKESILDAIVGEQLMVNFIDSNDMVVTPTRSDVEKKKQHAEVYDAGEERLKQIDPAQDGINAVKEDLAGDFKEREELIALSYQPGTNSQNPDGSIYDESDKLPPLIMDFEGDDEEVDDSEMSL